MWLKVLSLFDGMSCGQIALKNIQLKVDEYFASEIDKHAIYVAKTNFPEMIHLWDIKWLDYSNWFCDFDILIWWSPCQWFSRSWKWLNFNDPRSALFFEYVRLLKETKPKYFFLENVVMKKEWQNVISDYLWIQPIKINSWLLTA